MSNFFTDFEKWKNAHLISIDYVVDPLLNHGLKTDATAQSLCENETKEKSAPTTHLIRNIIPSILFTI